ncbi:curli production assembly/transport component CsgF [Cyclobacterium plantarum]|uniref:Curli production assembly/transport component CsgF n=1 Tax=Cyclobacterium plantarum TaxID=2716263 RepID=A0ABX0HAE2_9BACT|nr:curli production assembly/transport component CsgF [Cyclobacterium plantarum]NHE58859.1 curli production assembly/transport component CsgF [Cyclobacterium plantarum]
MKKILFILTLCIYYSIGFCEAQQMVYKPKNPAFGGETFNYQWMLSSAQAQDTTVDPSQQQRTQTGFSQRSPLNDFTESLNRQILSRLSRELVLRQFGEDEIQEGSYQLGDYQIEIGSGGAGININIVDNRTGASTVVDVPFF